MDGWMDAWMDGWMDGGMDGIGDDLSTFSHVGGLLLFLDGGGPSATCKGNRMSIWIVGLSSPEVMQQLASLEPQPQATFRGSAAHGEVHASDALCFGLCEGMASSIMDIMRVWPADTTFVSSAKAGCCHGNARWR